MGELIGAEKELYEFIKAECEHYERGVPYFKIERWASKRLYISTLDVLLGKLIEKGLIYSPLPFMWKCI